MSAICHLVQDLRNAYYGRSNDTFEATLKRIEKLGELVPIDGCTRGPACVCNQHIKAVCMYRVHDNK